MSEITRKRRSPADRDSLKRVREDISQTKSSIESMSKQLLQVVEYLTMVEIRIQQLELLMDNQGEAIKELQKTRSPDFSPPYFDRTEFTTPLELSHSESDINIDLLSFEDEDLQLLHISPLSLEEHPGTILNLLCNEVME